MSIDALTIPEYICTDHRWTDHTWTVTDHYVVEQGGEGPSGQRNHVVYPGHQL